MHYSARQRHRYTQAAIVLLACAAVFSPSVGSADTLAYIRADSQLQRTKNPAKYHPLNLLDDDPATAWCEGASGDGERQEIRIFFKRPQRIDRIVVTPAASTGRTIDTIAITDGTNTVRIPVGTSIVEQPVTPPMRGNEYTITLEAVGPANDGSSLTPDDACLADVMLYFKKRPFGGKVDPSSFRYNVRKDKLLGRWLGGPLGAPEKYLTFAIDGTWTWRYEPILGGKKMRLNGEYRFRGNRLLMRKGETGRWSDMRFKHEIIKKTQDSIVEGDYDQISLGDAVNKQLGGNYNNAEF